jgi:hypothetical protein
METQTWRQLLEILNAMDDNALDQTRTIEIAGQTYFSVATVEPGPVGHDEVKDRGHKPT